MVCSIFFCSESPDIPEKSLRRRWRKLADAKRFAYQENAKKIIKPVPFEGKFLIHKTMIPNVCFL